MSISEKSITDIKVYFVQTGNSPNEATDIMQSAFEAIHSFELEPVWISTTDCLKVSKKSNEMFIMDPFEGKVFDYLKSLNCRIVGPLCILYCIHYSEALPKRPYPIYSVSMRKLTVCCSSVDSQCRQDISKKVQLMGGFFSKDFTENVTHLIVDEVGSEKYKAATKLGRPVMVSDWVTDVWETAQHKQIHAAHKCFKKYKCPAFKGLIITVSQLNPEERSMIKTIVEENGGIYSGTLKFRETTHLILTEPTGDKYIFAKKWNISCVNIKWICDSVNAGYCKDENLYEVKDTFKTPSCPAQNGDSLDDSASNACNASVTHLDETIRNNVSISSKNSKFSTLDNFDFASLPKVSQCLDGCKIYLTGFNQLHLDKLRKVVNSGGGMRFSKYSDSISHVVCGDISADFLQSLSNSLVKPYVVNFNWLLECCKNETLVDEKPFLCMDVTPLSPDKDESTLSKREMFTTFVPNSQPLENIDIDNNFTDIFQQYINNQNSYDEDEFRNKEMKDTSLVSDSQLQKENIHKTNAVLQECIENNGNFFCRKNIETVDSVSESNEDEKSPICFESNSQLMTDTALQDNAGKKSRQLVKNKKHKTFCSNGKNYASSFKESVPQKDSQIPIVLISHADKEITLQGDTCDISPEHIKVLSNENNCTKNEKSARHGNTFVVKESAKTQNVRKCLSAFNSDTPIISSRPRRACAQQLSYNETEAYRKQKLTIKNAKNNIHSAMESSAAKSKTSVKKRKSSVSNISNATKIKNRRGSEEF